MKIYEITNPQDQLALLKTIMDNTWNAISMQGRVNPEIPKTATIRTTKERFKPKKISKPKKGPYAAPPKPLPKAKPIPPTPQQIKSKQEKNLQNVTQQLQKSIPKNQNKNKPMPGAPKELPTSIVSPINLDRSPAEWQELAKQARGETPIKPI